MKIAIATFWSWLAVTVIYVLTMFIDGSPFSFTETSGMLAFLVLVGFIVAIYFAVFGGAAWYILSKKEQSTRVNFLQAGVCASIPMLVFCILSGELEWVLATLIAGFIGSATYALLLPKTIST